jgi:hypothetical protein
MPILIEVFVWFWRQDAGRVVHVLGLDSACYVSGASGGWGGLMARALRAEASLGAVELPLSRLKLNFLAAKRNAAKVLFTSEHHQVFIEWRQAPMSCWRTAATKIPISFHLYSYDFHHLSHFLASVFLTSPDLSVVLEHP